MEQQCFSRSFYLVGTPLFCVRPPFCVLVKQACAYINKNVGYLRPTRKRKADKRHMQQFFKGTNNILFIHINYDTFVYTKTALFTPGIKETVQPKIKIHYFLFLLRFQTFRSLFIMLNTKEDILKIPWNKKDK